MMSSKKNRGVILLDVAAASAVMVLVTLTLAGLFVTTLQIAESAGAVTRGRLLAQTHIEQARAGSAPGELTRDELISKLTLTEIDGIVYWQVEVQGESLLKPLQMVSGQ